MKNYKGRSEIVITFIMTFSAVLITTSTSAQIKVESGQIFRDCPECPEMVVIPAGSFTMGSPQNETGYSDVEGPQISVSIAQFAAGKFDVTRGQWEAFVNQTNRPIMAGCAFSGFKDNIHKDWDPNPNASWHNLGFHQDSTHPVVCITWNDAQDYIKCLSQKTGHIYRLLTESEWEYAARAGTITAYLWGGFFQPRVCQL